MTLCIALPICCAAYLFPTNRWWRMTGSNRRPPACKAGALPAELIPQIPHVVVGLVGLEPTTPALSRRCSNQLSYRPGRLGERSSHLLDRSPPLHFDCSCAIAGAQPIHLLPLASSFKQPISVSATTRLDAALKGGDPAAPSDTATLLRLHPSHEPHRGNRPPCG